MPADIRNGKGGGSLTINGQEANAGDLKELEKFGPEMRAMMERALTAKWHSGADVDLPPGSTPTVGIPNDLSIEISLFFQSFVSGRAADQAYPQSAISLSVD